MVTEETYQQLSTVLGGIVERKPLDDVLQDVTGADTGALLDQAIAPQSSAAVRNYVEEQIVEEYGLLTGTDNDDLYLVKKVHCNPQEYAAMADAVSQEDTDKFNVVLGISAEPDLINYQSDEPGIEYTLTAADNPTTAFHNAADTDPHLNASHTNFDPATAERVDHHATNAVYNHQPEDFETFFTEISDMLGLQLE